MGLFRKKKKDEKVKKALPFYIDWRMSPEEYLKLAFFGAIILFIVSWGSIIASSLLYFLAIGGVLIVFMYYREEMTGKFRYLAPFLAGMFFLLFSLSGNRGAYIFGAYLSSFFINIVGYWAIKNGIIDRERELRGGEEW